MRKMIAFLLTLISLLGIGQIKTNNFQYLLDDYQKVVIVCDSKQENLEESYIKNGGDYIYVLSGSDKDINKLFEMAGCKGISFYYSLEHSFEEFNDYFNYTLIKGESFDDYDIYYGFYENFNDFRLIDGRKINLQLARTKDGWILGFPLILTGF